MTSKQGARYTHVHKITYQYYNMEENKKCKEEKSTHHLEMKLRPGASSYMA
jgi:hypothetical protein